MCEEIALSLSDVPKEKQFITGAGVFETNMHLRTEQREGKCEPFESYFPSKYADILPSRISAPSDD